MPLSREEHEAILNQALGAETVAERTELLSQLRDDHAETISILGANTSTIDKLTSERDDLIVSHSQMFRRQGTVNDPDLAKKEEEKTFSETVTIDQLG